MNFFHTLLLPIYTYLDHPKFKYNFFSWNFDILYLFKIFILVLKVEKSDEMQLNMARSCDKKKIGNIPYVLSISFIKVIKRRRTNTHLKCIVFQNDSCIYGVEGSFISHSFIVSY
jgi:hypothetical protein